MAIKDLRKLNEEKVAQVEAKELLEIAGFTVTEGEVEVVVTEEAAKAVLVKTNLQLLKKKW